MFLNEKNYNRIVQLRHKKEISKLNLLSEILLILWSSYNPDRTFSRTVFFSQ